MTPIGAESRAAIVPEETGAWAYSVEEHAVIAPTTRASTPKGRALPRLAWPKKEKGRL